MLLRAAVNYVARHGAPLDRLHVEVLTGKRPAAALLEGLAARQGKDGAIPDWREAADDTPVVAADAAQRGTLRALGVLDGLGLYDHALPERAVGWLAAQQDPDGGFGGAAAAPSQRIELTGAVAGLLARSPFARATLLRRAERFLAARWDVSLVQGPNYGPIRAYLHLMSGFDSELSDEVLNWCGRELERGFRTRVFDPVAVARVFCLAHARALPGARLEPAEVLGAFVQQADGSFNPPASSRDDTPRDATLDAIEALLRLSQP